MTLQAAVGLASEARDKAARLELADHLRGERLGRLEAGFQDDIGVLRRLVGLSTPVKFLISPASARL